MKIRILLLVIYIEYKLSASYAQDGEENKCNERLSKLFISFTVNNISLQNPRKLLMELRDSVGHSLKATPWRYESGGAVWRPHKDVPRMVAMESLEASFSLPAVVFLPALSGQCQPIKVLVTYEGCYCQHSQVQEGWTNRGGRCKGWGAWRELMCRSPFLAISVDRDQWSASHMKHFITREKPAVHCVGSWAGPRGILVWRKT